MNEKQEKLLKALEDYYDEKDKNRVHTPGKDVIQHAGPYLRKEEFMAAIGTLLKEWMVQGENAQKFENEFCKLMGQPYGVVTNSGSSANLLMLAALKSKLTPDFITSLHRIHLNHIIIRRRRERRDRHSCCVYGVGGLNP